MQHSQVISYRDLSPKAAETKLRAIAKDSSNVFLTGHAKARMRQRKITLKQIICCLEHGAIKEGPARNTKGNWLITLEVISAGDIIKGVFELEYDEELQNFVVVVTVIRG